jgi:glycosyltransferase involved in cell wall biosynthesis
MHTSIKQSLVIYSLPHFNFFSQHNGVGGHIAHAIGDVQGLRKNDCKVIAVIPSMAPLFFIKECYKVIVIPEKSTRFNWNNAMLSAIIQTTKTYRADFIYMRYSAGFTPWIPWLKWRANTTPIILEVNALLSQRAPVAYLLDRVVLRLVDDVVTISEKQAKVIRRIGGYSMRRRIAVMPNAVDHTRFNDLDKQVSSDYMKHPTRNNCLRIGYIGILKPGYGLELLLDAYSEIRQIRSDVELMICGEGPLYKDLLDQAKKIPNVLITGAIPFDSVPYYLQSIDIAVYTTTQNNIFQNPIKMYEYMASACAIVAAKTPVTNDLLHQGKFGILYDIGSQKQLVEGITSLLEDDKRRTDFGCIVHENVVQKHTWTIRFRDYIARLKENDIL